MPLDLNVVYDSWIHGSWRRIRIRTNERHGLVTNMEAQSWTQHYVMERKNWLATHSNSLLHKTVYRMNSFQLLMDQEKWELDLPLRVRGNILDYENLSVISTGKVIALDEDDCILKFRRPLMKGQDLKEGQQSLVRSGVVVDVDDFFGSKTEGGGANFNRIKEYSLLELLALSLRLL